MTTRERTVIAQAWVSRDGRWRFEGRDADQWLALGQDYARQGKTDDADDAYLVSNRLQGLDNHEDETTNPSMEGDRIMSRPISVPCHVCNKRISTHGGAFANHMKMHARQES